MRKSTETNPGTMTPRTAFWRWSLIGLAVAAILLVAQVREVGGITGLLQVGEASSLRPMIEAELGELPVVQGSGHDGQIFYAIGLDPGGQQVPDLLDHGGYRYRRILEPALAGMFGLLDGRALLIGMIVVTLLAAGVATGAVAATARAVGLSDWMALTVVLNPGVWLGIRLLTSDVLALALMALGLLGIVSGSRWAIAAFALSGLAKDVYLMTPGGLVLSEPRRRWRLFVLPALVLVAWMTWVTIAIGDGFTGRGNLALPFTGMIDAAAVWSAMGAGDVFYLVFALVSTTAALVVGVFRRGWLRWPLLGWGVLAVVSSNWVWDFGNNAARAFAPIAVLVALAFGALPVTVETQPTSSRKNLPV